MGNLSSPNSIPEGFPYLLEIIFPQPIPKGYHYLGLRPFTPGQRVLVNLRGSLTVGMVYECSPLTEEQGLKMIKYKPVEEALDDEPVYPQRLFPLLQRVAQHYLTPLGLVFKTALPASLFKVPTWKVTLTEKGRYLLSVGERLKDLSLLNQKDLRVKNFLKRTGLKKLDLRRLEAEELVKVYPELPRVNLPKEKILKLVRGDDLPAELRELFSDLAEVPLSLALKKVSHRRIKIYLQMGLVEVYEVPKLRKINLLVDEPTHYSLTPLQEKTAEKIWRRIHGGTFQPILLYGITGSGKTLIYLELIRKVLGAGRRVLVLLPEIILTSYMERLIFRQFGSEVAILHSALLPAQRLSEWMRILKGEAKVVVGTRSAVFAPIANLGLIIVDEEHDPSYKEENFPPRYQARDVALMRGDLEGVPVLLGSATPSVKSFYLAQRGKYHYFEITERPFTKTPEIRVIENKKFHLLSKEVLEEITETVRFGRSVLVFLNRRGYAPLVRCKDCHHLFICPNCDLPLTYHLDDRSLQCHHCYFEVKFGLLCPNCGSGFIKLLKSGTERIEEDLKRLFPEVEIIRFDRDTAGSDRRINLLLERLYTPIPKIIVATQMGIQGHNFPQVNLVVVLRAEEGLMMPTYKAVERSFQLLLQASGRAGRRDEVGKVILQTSFPEHYVIKYAIKQDYKGFYQEEIKKRLEFGYPPFMRLGIIKISGINYDKVRVLAKEVRDKLLEVNRELGLNCQIFPPSPAPLGRLRGLYRWQILIKGAKHSAVASLLTTLSNLKPSGIKIEFDLDPEEMM